MAGNVTKLEQEMHGTGIGIPGLSEVRWTGSGVQQNKHDHIFSSGGVLLQHGVSMIVSQSSK